MTGIILTIREVFVYLFVIVIYVHVYHLVTQLTQDVESMLD